MRLIQNTQSFQRPADATAYATGDVVSEVTTNGHYTFPLSATRERVNGIIRSARLVLNANQGTKPDLELWLFSADIANVADNAAFNPTDAEVRTAIGMIPFPVASFKVGRAGAGAAGNIFQQVDKIDLAFTAGVIYGQLVIRNAYTPVASTQHDCSLLILAN